MFYSYDYTVKEEAIEQVSGEVACSLLFTGNLPILQC